MFNPLPRPYLAKIQIIIAIHPPEPVAARLICRAFAQLDIVWTSALSEAEKPDKTGALHPAIHPPEAIAILFVFSLKSVI